ncbi:hypothetical protein LSUE1_G001353 [Lachnellula suecica]|uniref:Protein kinase domain-containing protein n=1 Tax=Lachnellula suecica TaxID=602035 RepID=A0A8T9CGF7_9HELO|nr:hypothetical protein LSUE1_G001353 [Lachnellula suecica]
MDNKIAPDWESHINKQLELSTRSRAYACVKVLILYWVGGDPGFEVEGRELGQLFADKETFNFAVEEFAIPRSNSCLELKQSIIRSILDLSSYADEKRGASLLIIHYGGHGDQNDDKHKGEEQRSVWAAEQADGPTLDWFRIQEDLMTAESHILLLFDCCFAAQAGRERHHRPSRIDLLAAAAMGMKTPMPGGNSFTKALIREISTGFEKQQHVIVSELHRRLVARESKLWAIPFYVKLGQEQTPIRLERLSENLFPKPADGTNSFSFQLKIDAGTQLNESNLNQIARWLGDNTPSAIAKLHVEKILETTTCIQQFVENIRDGDQPLVVGLPNAAIEDILGTWENAVAIINQTLAQQRGPDLTYKDVPIIKDLAEKLLSQLEEENSGFVDLLEQKLLSSSTISDQAIESVAASKLGVADQLRLRKVVRSPPTSNIEAPEAPREDFKAELMEMQEYKSYGPYMDPADIPALEKRVSHLAELLSAPKSPEFLSLKCLRWLHEPLENRYILDFEIPRIYDKGEGKYQTLMSIIQGSRGTERPSLDERFRMALLLARAVRKWHSVGWLHQGISSSNIIFFNFHPGGKVDYSRPFLAGFEFARPDSDPSIGHAADDLTFNVYRHPLRQGDARKGHRRIHDIYSLGVVALEIGLWQRAFDIVSSRGNQPLSAQIVQQKLQVASNERLPHYAGSSYSAAVDACLTSKCMVDLDDENESQLGRSFEKAVINQLVKGIDVK